MNENQMLMGPHGFQIAGPVLDGSTARYLFIATPPFAVNPLTVYPRTDMQTEYTTADGWRTALTSAYDGNTYAFHRTAAKSGYSQASQVAVISGSVVAFSTAESANGGMAFVGPVLLIEGHTSDHSPAAEGMIQYRSDTNELSYYDGTSWQIIANTGDAGGGIVVPGLPYPLLGSSIAGEADVTISSDTTYTSQALKMQVAGDFTIQNGFTLTARQGLFLVCDTFTCAGTLDASGATGAAPVAQTGGVAGANGAGALGSDGGTGGSGVATGNNGAVGGTPTAITNTANVPDLTNSPQASELGMLASAFGSPGQDSSATLSGFPGADFWGMGGRGGGGGGGGGASGGRDGGAGGAGGDATGFRNPNGGAAGAAGVGGAGGDGGANSAFNLSTGFAKVFGNLVALWYYGAGTGGGGGASGGNNQGSGTSGAGGGGGAGGAPVIIICNTFNNTGTIRTDGGAGGAGGAASAAAAQRGQGGGGSGGGAGNLIIIARNVTALGTLSSAGGAAGAGSSGGLGTAGGNGAVGRPAVTGATGLVIRGGS